MSWLEEHLSTFVDPFTWSYERKPLGYFTPEEHTVIKNAWRSVKRQAQHKPILLAGRDVFIFEVLARRENYPTKFVPECSRMTAEFLRPVLSDKDYFLFDTGFAGSIPKKLGIESFSLLSYLYRFDPDNKQVFPRLSFSRGLALKIEKTPKYWESGRVGVGPDGKEEVIQLFNSVNEFQEAAQLTIEIYTNSSPKFINRHRPMGGGA